MILYVSRGIGMYRPPVRFHCRPELLVFRVD
jgi:predicted MPP superfamily phosphohydrolase